MQLPSNTLLQGGKYKIIEKIGQGGFGIAYKAYHQGLQSEVCIKEFFFSDLCERSHSSYDITIVSKSAEKIKLVDSLQKKFTKEAQRLAKFQHPNIVQVMDTFDENNTAYFVMEFLDGGSLEDLIKRDGAMSEQKAKALILPIIDAMDAVHKKDLLHLDIKPANIMLRQNQSPVLIDFGISKYLENSIVSENTKTTAAIGISMGYAPLEQYMGSISDFTKATDIYSICATIYRMVTGVIPPEPLQIMIYGLKSPSDLNLETSANFDKSILKGLSIYAVDRQQNMHELKIELTARTSFQDQFNVYSNNLSLNQYGKLHKYSFISSFNKGMAKVESNGKWGFIDMNGNEVIPCKYDKETHFVEDRSIVMRANKWGAIDKKGLEIIPYKYDSISDFYDGYAKVELNGKYGVIDKNGYEIISCKYSNVIDRVDGKPNIWSIFISDQTIIASNKIPIFIDNVALVELDNRSVFVNKNMKEIKPNCWRTNFRDGLSVVSSSLKGKYGFVNRSGNEVISRNYDYAYDFVEGLSAVKSNEKWGFIDKDGNTVISCKYDQVDSFSEGLAKVVLNDRWAFINKKGTLVFQGKNQYAYIYSFKNGMCRVKFNDKYGFIDNIGQEVIPCKFYDVSDFLKV